MSNPEVDPSIAKFKKFVQDHPGLIREVRNGNYRWQDFYEQWVLLGESDTSWETYLQDATSKKKEEPNKKKKSKQDWMKQVSGLMEKVDMNKMEGNIEQLNGAITNIQSLLAQFKDETKQQTPTKPSNPSTRRPFQFYRD
ncbi:YlbD family protein [Paraliobacillus sediminis]|uniref:YlbD family protein n=1 Tax=Paraliobacillus sediminis TaxID=1885916 RepID=UPI000E3D8EE1|nr:spore coat protein YlbD [Paraliobacillus sediminis]